jgi:hypothetical protein
MIRCPVTGQAVSTEIETEPSIFGTLPQVETRTNCPACGQEHVWTRLDAWLAQQAGQQRTETCD